MGVNVTVGRVLKEMGVRPTPLLLGTVSSIIADAYARDCGTYPPSRVVPSKDGSRMAFVYNRQVWRERIVNTVNHMLDRDDRQMDFFP